MQSRRSSTLLTIGFGTLVYFTAGKLALRLAYVNASASPVWPPTGIALAALILFGYQMWPSIFVGAFLVNLTTAGSVATSLGIATGNTLEALCAAYLVNRLAGGSRAFDRAQAVFKFALATAVGALISATVGLTSLAWGHFATWDNFQTIWVTWWLGNVTGGLLFAPLIILWFVAPTRSWRHAEIVEVAFLGILLLAIGEIVFGGWFPISAKNYPIAFIFGPLVVWTAFRFTQRETATGIFILSGLAIWGTLHNLGPFVMETKNQSLLMLQASTGLLFMTAMALAGAMAERRRAEAVIEEQKRTIEAANQTKDNFLAMLSHELRTPLTPIVAALDTLRAGHLDLQESQDTLEMIRRNINLESQLIDDLLDLERIARNQLRLRVEPLDAHEAIANVLEICQTELDSKQLRLLLQINATSHYISADLPKFQQIIWNLVKNAIKFTGKDGTITIASSNESNEDITIRVSDTGIGIEPHMMDRIFNRFEQGDYSFQRRFGGLGLGLTISKSLAEAHGGTLRAESGGLNQGATFSFRIKTTAAPASTGRQSLAAADITRQQLRILLVDDHVDTNSAMERLLTKRGHVVATAPDMESAIKAAERDRFDLLISDVGLPDGSGLELMNRLRTYPNIRGIAVSGFGMNGDVQKSIQAGFSEHLVKPVTLEKLEGAIERVMSMHGQTQI